MRIASKTRRKKALSNSLCVRPSVPSPVTCENIIKSLPSCQVISHRIYSVLLKNPTGVCPFHFYKSLLGARITHAQDWFILELMLFGPFRVYFTVGHSKFSIHNCSLKSNSCVTRSDVKVVTKMSARAWGITASAICASIKFSFVTFSFETLDLIFDGTQRFQRCFFLRSETLKAYFSSTMRVAYYCQWLAWLHEKPSLL